MNFERWYTVNQETEFLWEHYLDYSQLMNSKGSQPLPFKEWAKEFFNKEIENENE